ncbi:hypothetical protein [Desulfobacterium sp. N47]|uniref:Uncharacterized protein n=1 Tax=uncultured Desulfobacterium sp. TaxID=201089 RepID=E1YCQ3_9BACT|nr:hypothetical protein N47_G36710 [uncultured Desulfobacterium sp.]
MKPLYFPFTYINDAKAADLCACFKQITVYQPGFLDLPENMQELSKKGLIDIRIPVSGDESKLKAILNEYKTWAKLHQKSDMAFLNAAEEKIPFFDETFSSELASQIKKNMGGNQQKSKTDFLFNSRLFLGLAQEYDEQQDGLARDMISVSEMEKKLLSELTDEDEMLFAGNSDDALRPGYDPEKYKIKERLVAWSHLVLNDIKRPEIFITDSKDAFDYIIENNFDPETAIDLHSTSVCLAPDITDNRQIMLAKQIEGLLSDKSFKISEDIKNVLGADRSGRNISLRILRISNISRYEFLQNILSRDNDIRQNNGNDDETGNYILIGIVEE